MSVYLIIDITVIDQGLYEEYVAQVPAVVEQYGGRYLVRGGEVVGHGRRLAARTDRGDGIRDPAIRRRNIFTSPEYLALVPLREKSTTSRAIIVEGYEYDL